MRTALIALALAPSAALAFTSYYSLTEIAPPASVEAGELVSDTDIHGFYEGTCSSLTDDLDVDITDAGTVDSVDDLSPGVISAGTRARCVMVHMEADTDDIRLAGGLQAPDDILGIIVTADGLDDSDDICGGAGTDYPTGDAARGLELDGEDRLQFTGTFSTRFQLTGPADDLDQVRVIVDCFGIGPGNGPG